MSGARLVAIALFGVGAVACGSASDGAAGGAPAPASSAAAPDAATPAPEPAELAPPTHLRVAVVGDVLPHSPLWRQAARTAGGDGFDFGPMFAEIEPALRSADLAICHLETPIAPAGEEFTTDPLYGVPPQIADAIAGAGFDRCSLASNHAFDRGVAGIDRTVEVLTGAGVGQSGMARTEAESRPRVVDVGGVAVAHLSYTYGHNGNWVPPGEEWRAPLIDPGRIVGDATEARQLGAQLVIVSLHWGTERQSEPSAEQRAVAEAITASGAIDLVVGHHAHVLQPIEQVNGVWVAYGLGNILSNLPVNDSWPPASQDAAIVEFPVTVAGSGDIEVGPPSARPTWVDKDGGWVIRDVLADLADPSTAGARRQELEASLERTRQVIGAFVAADGA